jgi:uncharacterized membrane protein YccF (DUF307 family)
MKYVLNYCQSLIYFAGDDEKLKFLRSLNTYEMKMVSVVVTINESKKLACYEIGASEYTENLVPFGNTILEEDDYEGVISTLDDLGLRKLTKNSWG